MNLGSSSGVATPLWPMTNSSERCGIVDSRGRSLDQPFVIDDGLDEQEIEPPDNKLLVLQRLSLKASVGVTTSQAPVIIEDDDDAPTNDDVRVVDDEEVAIVERTVEPVRTADATTVSEVPAVQTINNAADSVVQTEADCNNTQYASEEEEEEEEEIPEEFIEVTDSEESTSPTIANGLSADNQLPQLPNQNKLCADVCLEVASQTARCGSQIDTREEVETSGTQSIKTIQPDLLLDSEPATITAKTTRTSALSEVCESTLSIICTSTSTTVSTPEMDSSQLPTDESSARDLPLPARDTCLPSDTGPCALVSTSSCADSTLSRGIALLKAVSAPQTLIDLVNDSYYDSTWVDHRNNPPKDHLSRKESNLLAQFSYPPVYIAGIVASLAAITGRKLSCISTHYRPAEPPIEDFDAENLLPALEKLSCTQQFSSILMKSLRDGRTCKEALKSFILDPKPDSGVILHELFLAVSQIKNGCLELVPKPSSKRPRLCAPQMKPVYNESVTEQTCDALMDSSTGLASVQVPNSAASSSSCTGEIEPISSTSVCATKSDEPAILRSPPDNGPCSTVNSCTMLLMQPTRYFWSCSGDISNGVYPIPVTAVNEIDHTPLPEDAFEWLRESKISFSVPWGAAVACCHFCQGVCLDNCQCMTENKNENLISSKPFDDTGKILIPPPSPIYECNSFCTCTESCSLRTIQNSLKLGPYPVQIFRTPHTGWGLRATCTIPKGMFVAEYIGELITDEEAQERSSDVSYLFDLDIEGSTTFVIDADRCGNIARFLNHSCEPNLVQYWFWIDHLDKRLPRIAFFSAREIPPLTELTFDYCMKLVGGRKKTKCLCGSKNCRRWLAQ
ncbi:histone-lysine n-methyltransferase [Pelomyxa schiedti]|nr:histone-lysine n-methyltransferase [Pelomyxa schiedti]